MARIGKRTAGGAVDHDQAVERLRASYAAIPAGQPVRLAKSTSNLFRPRSATQTPGLDVGALNRVLEVHPATKSGGVATADVQGMTSYEDLVAATLPHDLIPLVVPQLRTITLGGAVTGLGIESTSFRNGLPHESVLEMDIFTGAGEVVTARPEGEHADLFGAFPNSYGSLGYATRLRIELELVPGLVRLRHVRFHSADDLALAVAAIVEDHAWEGQHVDAVDGVMFAPDELYLTLATWGAGDYAFAGAEDPDYLGPFAGETGWSASPSDYTGQDIYFRSLQQRKTDLLTMHDYLWRWDTDWFWCSGAFGVHNPRIRRLWPRRWRRSDVYHKLVGLDRRFDIADRLDKRARRPLRERVIQDVEVTVDRLPEFLEWFDREVGMRPVWLCPLRLREPDGPGSARSWSGYPLTPGTTYINVGFWGTVPVGPEAVDAPRNRAIEARLQELGGHKSLYSEAFYDKETFDRLYNGPALAAVKARYDPDDRLTDLYDKVVKRR